MWFWYVVLHKRAFKSTFSTIGAIACDMLLSWRGLGSFPAGLRPDGDLYLIFLSGNGVDFLEQTNDPWYRGAGFRPDGTIFNIDEPDERHTLYKPQDAASPMGCIMRYQYCNAQGQCGDLASFADAITSAAPFFDLTTKDIRAGTFVPISASARRFSWFENILSSATDINHLLQSLGAFLAIIAAEPLAGFHGTASGQPVAARCDPLVGNNTCLAFNRHSSAQQLIPVTPRSCLIRHLPMTLTLKRCVITR